MIVTAIFFVDRIEFVLIEQFKFSIKDIPLGFTAILRDIDRYRPRNTFGVAPI
ncbi:MAG: hypothetical protein IPJ05_02875 [Nitrosomonas sp.]|nr:hypothetical protein [Nitrosomonas sp.]